MKRNLLSILILALLVVNIVMTAMMMFTVIPANRKTIALVGDIASVLNLELQNPLEKAEAENVEVSIDDVVVYDIEDQMTIALKHGEDGVTHYAVISVSLLMNTKNEDYETYGAELATKESLIKNDIIEVVSNYTLEEAQGDTVALQNDVLSKIQEMFDSQFIYKVAFRDVMFQ